MAQSADFEGDEFSNNLFSDLAPLLTLFGEQVTKQFLSMSMGWADNILLAMGPLGIITTVVSAIRVGGGRTMKALVGRARENQSTAEQELLSSTSSNVCELWSGQQIVRLIGETEGARTLLVAGDGKVFDLKSAEDEGLIELSHPHETLEISTDSLHNPTPNLALNSGKAIASQTELWFWAAIGILLQLFATAFPGITTYSWGWSKAGIPVAPYAYPCFLMGTIFLTLGVTLCGHIIEGVTTEQNVSLTRDGERRGLRFFSLQRSRTVGDQRFPSCVLFLAEDDNILKVSRLNSKKYRNLAALGTFVAVAGYIVQFVGFRALHWSATIVQLGTTLAMTGIRAWVRRSLTSDPQTASTLQGQEVSWLALNIAWTNFDRLRQVSRRHSQPAYMNSGERDYVRSNLFRWCKNVMPRRFFKAHERFDHTSASSRYGSRTTENHQNDTRLLWSLVSYRNPHYQDDFWDESPRQHAKKNVYYHLRGRHYPWETSLRQRTSTSFTTACDGNDLTAKLIQAYESINNSIPHETSSQKVTALSTALCAVIAKTMESLSYGTMTTWKSTSDWAWFKDDLPEYSFELCWELSVSLLSDKYVNFILQNKLAGLLHLHLSARRNHSGRLLWEPPSMESIRAAISLSLHSEAMLSALVTGRSESPSARRDESSSGSFRRIIGYANHHEVEAEIRKISRWIIQPIFSTQLLRTPGLPQSFHEETLPEGAEALPSYLGMFLASSFRDHFSFTRLVNSSTRAISVGVSRDAPYFQGEPPLELVLYIQPYHGSTKALQYAQELLSIFILAAASVIESVNGETVRKAREDGSGLERLENSVFKIIASEIVEQGLARDVEEAYTLIIPAFAKYNLLPTESSERNSATSENQEAQVIITASPSFDSDSASEELELQQNPTPQHSSAPLQQPQDSIPQQSPTEQQDSTTTHQDPSLEQGSLVHPQPSQQSHVSELSAAQPSEETDSQPTEL